MHERQHPFLHCPSSIPMAPSGRRSWVKNECLLLSEVEPSSLEVCRSAEALCADWEVDFGRCRMCVGVRFGVGAISQDK